MYNHYNDYSDKQIEQLCQLVKNQSLLTSLEIIFAWPQVCVGFAPKPYSGKEEIHPNIIVQLSDDSCWHIGEAYMDGLYKDVVQFPSDWSCKYPQIDSPKDYFEFPTMPKEEEWSLYLLEVGEEYKDLHPATIASKLRDNYFKRVYGEMKC